jgi:hypothetical protein
MKQILLEMHSSDITKRSIRVIERVMQLHKPDNVKSMIINFDHEMSGGDDYFAEVTFVCPNIEPLFFQFDEDSIKEVIKDALFYWGQALKKTVKEFTGKNLYFTDKHISY